jgi:mannose-1-phosphate guanylyltransferase
MTLAGHREESGSGSVWALILAAGEGTRLRSLTTTVGGLTVPKQFCSLHGGESLLEEALGRGESVAHSGRVAAVVAAQHRHWWNLPLRGLAPENLIVQPDNRGTAVGLLLPLLHLVRRDPDAVVVVLPADHFVRDEAVLARSLQHAAGLARADRRHVFLLGVAPDRADSELGYIVPSGDIAAGAGLVRRFVEKPDLAVAHSLVGAGALWNAFILAASAQALLSLYERRHASLAASLAAAVCSDAGSPWDSAATRRLYATLPSLDFSRDVLEGQEGRLRVLEVPSCGWNDLGTPQRVAETLERHRHSRRPAPSAPPSLHLSLADQHFRRQCVV